jgi:hypothetical protein
VLALRLTESRRATAGPPLLRCPHLRRLLLLFCLFRGRLPLLRRRQRLLLPLDCLDWYVWLTLSGPCNSPLVIRKSWTSGADISLSNSALSGGVGKYRLGGGSAAVNRSKTRRKLISRCSGDGPMMTGPIDGTAHGTIGRLRYSSRRPSLVFL